jgi:hypothetical protein
LRIFTLSFEVKTFALNNISWDNLNETIQNIFSKKLNLLFRSFIQNKELNIINPSPSYQSVSTYDIAAGSIQRLVKGILINLISPVQDEIGFKSPNVLNKSNTEFEFNLKTTSRVDAIKQILNTILTVFSKADKLIVDGSETEDQTKLIELVKEFTSILLAHVTSIKTVADYQPIYTCMYNYLVPKWPAKTNLLIDNTSLQVRDNILYTTIPNNNKVLFSKFENETRKEVPKTDTGTIDTSTTGQSALSQGVKKKRMGF